MTTGTRLCALMCGLALLAGCGAATQTAVSGKAAVTAVAASSDTQRSGSCQIRGGDGALMVCQDFYNRPGSELGGVEENRCIFSGARWSNTACTKDDRIGGCKSKVDENGAYVIQWYYLPQLASEAREMCTRDGNSTWID